MYVWSLIYSFVSKKSTIICVCQCICLYYYSHIIKCLIFSYLLIKDKSFIKNPHPYASLILHDFHTFHSFMYMQIIHIIWVDECKKYFFILYSINWNRLASCDSYFITICNFSLMITTTNYYSLSLIVLLV
jgi:hypothetical protein